jgi:hypothetical protein
MSHQPYHFYVLLTVVFFMLCISALSQQPLQQPSQIDTEIDVTFTSIQPTKNGLQVSVSYVSHLPEPIQFTLTHPQDKAGFASDNLGNEYTLANATGMVRKNENPNFDLLGAAPHMHSTFLLAPPNRKVSASFLFKRTTQEAGKEKATAFNISISHYARPANSFDPIKDASRAFGFTATITNAKPL